MAVGVGVVVGVVVAVAVAVGRNDIEPTELRTVRELTLDMGTRPGLGLPAPTAALEAFREFPMFVPSNLTTRGDTGNTRFARTIIPVSRARLPAWCATARGVGTIYISVDMPKDTCNNAR